jgi:nucleoid DNA-binding protein
VAKVTKKEIVKQISEDTGLTQLQAKKIVQMTFDAIIETLVRESRIELRNFGVFEVKLRKARKARNPRTNEDVHVGPKNVVTFQPGKKMEESVRRMPLVEPRPRKPRKTRAAAARSADLDGIDDAASVHEPVLAGAAANALVNGADTVPSENGTSGAHEGSVATATVAAKKTRKRREK